MRKESVVIDSRVVTMELVKRKQIPDIFEILLVLPSDLMNNLFSCYKL
jgi:hypothetical protein